MFCVSSQECEDGTDHGNNFVCPLCTLDFSGPEKLISHVYQVRPVLPTCCLFADRVTSV